MIKKISISIALCFIFFASMIFTGCTQELTKFESSICGTYAFDDFWVYGNGVSASYTSLNQISNTELKTLVKSIGDYYKNSTLSLYDKKNGGKLDGSFYQSTSKSIKWFTNGENIGFENLLIYTVQGSKTSPIKKTVSEANCAKSNTGEMLSIVYYSDTFTSCIWFEIL